MYASRYVSRLLVPSSVINSAKREVLYTIKNKWEKKQVEIKIVYKTSRLALFITDDGTSSLETYLETYILTSFMSFNYRLSQHYRLCLMA